MNTTEWRAPLNTATRAASVAESAGGPGGGARPGQLAVGLDGFPLGGGQFLRGPLVLRHERAGGREPRERGPAPRVATAVPAPAMSAPPMSAMISRALLFSPFFRHSGSMSHPMDPYLRTAGRTHLQLLPGGRGARGAAAHGGAGGGFHPGRGRALRGLEAGRGGPRAAARTPCSRPSRPAPAPASPWATWFRPWPRGAVRWWWPPAPSSSSASCWRRTCRAPGASWAAPCKAVLAKGRSNYLCKTAWEALEAHPPGGVHHVRPRPVAGPAALGAGDPDRRPGGAGPLRRRGIGAVGQGQRPGRALHRAPVPALRGMPPHPAAPGDPGGRPRGGQPRPAAGGPGAARKRLRPGAAGRAGADPGRGPRDRGAAHRELRRAVVEPGHDPAVPRPGSRRPPRRPRPPPWTPCCRPGRTPGTPCWPTCPWAAAPSASTTTGWA